MTVVASSMWRKLQCGTEPNTRAAAAGDSRRKCYTAGVEYAMVGTARDGKQTETT